MALCREIIEEMQCKIEIGEQIEHTTYEYDFGIVHLTMFYCELNGGTPKLTEHISIKWIAPIDLLSLDWAPADIPTLEKLMNMGMK